MPKAQHVHGNYFASSRGIFLSIGRESQFPLLRKPISHSIAPAEMVRNVLSLRIVEGCGACERRRGVGHEPRAMGMV